MSKEANEARAVRQGAFMSNLRSSGRSEMIDAAGTTRGPSGTW